MVAGDAPDVYWPAEVPRVATLEAFHQLFAGLGYAPCKHSDLEPGFEKIALYVRDGEPEHAARQLPDGRWTSKLGKGVDVSHTLAGLEGPLYGQVVSFMKRPRPPA